LLRVLASIELFHVIGVKVTQISEELSSGGLFTTCFIHISERERVVDDIDSSHITLEFEEVIHDTSGGLVEISLAPLVEFLKPDLLYT